MVASISEARGRRLAVAGLVLAIGAVLADSSVVVLALPDILGSFNTSVSSVAWVITAFNLAMAICAVPAALLGRRIGTHRVCAAGAVVFAVGSLACAVAPDLTVLIIARCVQAAGGAALVCSALDLLAAELGDQRRAAGLWATSAAIGAAAGPMAGGVLTQAFDWRAIFVVQVPLGLVTVAARGIHRERLEAGPTRRPPWAPNIALALVAAGLTAALFLLVLLFVQGYQLSPIAAAFAVSTIPAAALVTGYFVRGEGNAVTRAASGSILIAGGLAALAFMPRAEVVWTLAPQVAVGVGLALAVPALSHAALQRGPLAVEGAWSIAARHAGVVLGLVILTPILVTDLTTQSARAEQGGAAIVLESPLSFGAKLSLGAALIQKLETSDNKVPDLHTVFQSQHPSAADRPAYDRIASALYDEVRRAATRAFRRAFEVAALLSLLALVPLLAMRRGPLRIAVVAAAGGAAVVLVGAALAAGGASFGPTAAPDPCAGRNWGPTGSLSSIAGEVALSTLNGAACHLHVQSATLALALASDNSMRDFQSRHHVTDAQLGDAIKQGLQQAVDDGQRSGDLNGLEADVLLATISHVPSSWLRRELPSALSLMR
ncbi:MAG: MFS transporter [Gaiellales bacterium]